MNKRQAEFLLFSTAGQYESRAESERERVVSDDGAAVWSVNRMVTFYDFPAEHWKHVTTNVVESPFAALEEEGYEGGKADIHAPSHQL